MKKIIFTFLISLIFLTSCYKVHTTESKTAKGYFLESKYEPEHREFTYHWGYNYMSGKYNYHWGNEDLPAKYSTVFIFLDDTLEYNSKELYNSVTDTFTVIYKDRYKMSDTDSTLIEHKIEKIIVKDTLNIYKKITI